MTFNVIPKELVSRLIVRLHKRMSPTERWRYGLYIIQGEVKALVRVETEPVPAETTTSVLAGRLANKDKLQLKNRLNLFL